MCGIVGYVGPRPALPILLEGLAALEYRGYDSAGVALVGTDGLSVVKRAGKVADLVEAAAELDHSETTGIGHTRWATCGAPTDRNAHPHTDCARRIALVHNGIIENHAVLRDELESQGHEFLSDTDTETVAHLIEGLVDEFGLFEATRRSLARLEGSYALVVVDREHPSKVVAARSDAPLVVGLGDGEAFVASDVVALIPHTRRAVLIEDGVVVELDASGARFIDLAGNAVSLPEIEVTWNVEQAEKGGYEHFMMKEIHEQPAAVRETLRGRTDAARRLVLDELRMSDQDVMDIRKIFVVACGSSYHAGLVAKYAMEHWTRLPVEIDVASEFRYRDPVLHEGTLVIGISQSGETADTLAALRFAKRQDAKVIAITNVVGSSITRDADAVLYTHAGPEVGVAATKTLTTQMASLWLLTLWIAQTAGLKYLQEVAELIDRLHEIPDEIERILADDSVIRSLAARYKDAPTFLFIGRGVGYPVALEGALKLKELSYLHAEGFAAGEMKHGPIALLEAGVPVVAIATRSHVQSKLLSNVEEARARGADIIAVINPEDEAQLHFDATMVVPSTLQLLSPILDVVPLQLFAYHIAVMRGLDPDKPRNLAKSVTVE